MTRVRALVIVGVIAAAAAVRLIPHPPNFTPIAAMALFSGAHMADRRLPFVIPLAAMGLSDLVIGLHALVPAVYLSFALIVCLGFWLRGRLSMVRAAAATLAGSVLFFIVTNFAVWAWGAMYPRTLAGLAEAYIVAIPFFRNTVLGDAFYAAVLFGGFAVLEYFVAALRVGQQRLTGLRSS